MSDPWRCQNLRPLRAPYHVTGWWLYSCVVRVCEENFVDCFIYHWFVFVVFLSLYFTVVIITASQTYTSRWQRQCCADDESWLSLFWVDWMFALTSSSVKACKVVYMYYMARCSRCCLFMIKFHVISLMWAVFKATVLCMSLACSICAAAAATDCTIVTWLYGTAQ